jgi:hypothetical protein
MGEGGIGGGGGGSGRIVCITTGGFGGKGGFGATWLIVITLRITKKESKITFFMVVVFHMMQKQLFSTYITNYSLWYIEKIPRCSGGSDCSWYRLQI